MDIKHEMLSPFGIFFFKFTAKSPIKQIPVSIMSTYSPTGNCQIASIQNFQNVLNTKTFNLEEQIEILKYMSKKVSKKNFLVDIKENLYPDFKKLVSIKNDVILNKKYISTNGSHMRMIIFKTEKFK